MFILDIALAIFIGAVGIGFGAILVGIAIDIFKNN